MSGSATHAALLSAGTVIAVSSPWTGKRDVSEASPRPGRHDLPDAERRLYGAGAGYAFDFAGPFREPDRPFSLGQEHDLQHRRRAIGTDQRPRTDRWRRCHRTHRPRRLHAAEGSALAVAHRARQRHPRHGDPGRAVAPGARARATAAAALWALRLRIPLSERAVRRHAPAS